jgi:Spy/CpxP family protein refolding chaperone
MKKAYLIALIMLAGLVYLGAVGLNPAIAASDDPDPGQELESPPVQTPDAQPPASFQCPKCGHEFPGFYGRHRHSGIRGDRTPDCFRDARAPRAPRAHRGRRGSRGAGRDVMPVDRILRGTERLELTDSQVKDLEKLSYDTRLKMIDMKSDLEKSQLEMKRLMQDGSDNMAAIKQQLSKLSGKKLAIQELRLENWFAARKLLTDDQKEKIRATHPRMGGML